MLRQADIWVLDRVYQPVADFVWDWTGVNCFGVARLFGGLYCLVCVLRAIDHVGGLWRGWGTVVIMAILGLVLQLGLIIQESQYKTGFANVCRLAQQLPRMVADYLAVAWVIGSFLSDTEVIEVMGTAVGQVFFVSMMYFGACSVRPRRPKRVAVGLPAIARVPG